MRLRRLLALLLSELLLGPTSILTVGAQTKTQVAAVAGPSTTTTVRGIAVTQGTDILNGDIVDVQQGGETVLLFGHNALVRVTGDSAVRLFKCSGTGISQVLHGSMVFRSTPQQPVEVQVGDALIRPTGANETIGEVSVATPNAVNITAQKASLAVTTAHDGKTLRIDEGKAVQAELSTPANATPNPSICGVAAAVASAPSTTVWVMLGTATAAVAAGAGLATTQTSLTCQQKAALVSPYAFPCP